MAELPEITLPDPVVVAAREEQSSQKAFMKTLNLAAFLDATPWTMDGSLCAYDLNTREQIGGDLPLRVDNLQLGMAVYPMVAQVGGGILTAVGLLLAPLKIEAQIVAGLAVITAKAQVVADAIDTGTAAINLATANKATAEHQLADWDQRIAQLQAGDSPTKTADIAYAQQQATIATAAVASAAADITNAIAAKATAIATAQADVLDAQRVVWVSLLGQWREASAPLGVTSQSVPMALYGLTPPEGV